MKKFKDKTDKWYKEQPEWGTPEATKKAKKKTPGQNEEVVNELSNKKLAQYSVGAKKDIIKLRNKRSKDVRPYGDERYDKSEKDLDRKSLNRWKYTKKADDKVIKRTANEDVAAMNTGAIPDPKVTVQGKKKKYKVLTRHYMEIMGKRRKIVK